MFNMLFTGGYEFLDPSPQPTANGIVPSPSDGARKLNARTAFFYPYTGIPPAMCMLLPGMGSQYLMAMRDGGGEYLGGARSYRLTLPPDIPESRFWSVMLYDRQTRSMLEGNQLDPDRPRQRLLHDPAALQPAPAVLRQELAAKRDRTDLTFRDCSQAAEQHPTQERPRRRVPRLRRQGARRGMRVRRPRHDGGRPPEELKRMNQ
jgi:hypothetical protein